MSTYVIKTPSGELRVRTIQISVGVEVEEKPIVRYMAKDMQSGFAAAGDTEAMAYKIASGRAMSVTLGSEKY